MQQSDKKEPCLRFWSGREGWSNHIYSSDKITGRVCYFKCPHATTKVIKIIGEGVCVRDAPFRRITTRDVKIGLCFKIFLHYRTLDPQFLAESDSKSHRAATGGKFKQKSLDIAK